MDLYEAIEIICKDYCKYPDIESGNKLADICDKCPMNKCEDLRWADHKTESNSEKPNNCEYAENPSGDVWECGCFLDTYCEHQIYDRNPDGTINIVECGYEPTTEDCSTVPTISKMEQVDEPKTQTKTQNSNFTFEKRTMLDCYNCKYFCTENCRECHYEPKDEPQTMVYPQVDGITPSVIAKNEPQIIKVGMATDSVTGKVLGVTLDTDCAWK